MLTIYDMSHGARSVHSSHASRKANASSDEEVDELATPPASQIPDVEDSSDEEQDTGYRRYTRHRRALTADEKVLAKIVRNGVDAEQLKLIKGITILLRTHKGMRCPQS